MSNANWETFTPPEPENPDSDAVIQYDLSMYLDTGAPNEGQEVNITREEFIALKRYLARYRGARQTGRKTDPELRQRLADILKGTWALAVLEDDRFNLHDRFPAIQYQIGLAMDLASNLKWED